MERFEDMIYDEDAVYTINAIKTVNGLKPTIVKKEDGKASIIYGGSVKTLETLKSFRAQLIELAADKVNMEYGSMKQIGGMPSWVEIGKQWGYTKEEEKILRDGLPVKKT